MVSTVLHWGLFFTEKKDRQTYELDKDRDRATAATTAQQYITCDLPKQNQGLKPKN